MSFIARSKRFTACGFVLLTGGCVVSTHGGTGQPPVVPAPPPADDEPMAGGVDSAPPPGQPSEIGARHVLIAYRGATRAAEYISRTREEAFERAAEVLQQAREGADFAELAKEYSDDRGSAAQGGSLGRFSRDQMVKEFSDAAFALEIGDVSDIVESQFGFHVIQRTE